MIKKAVKLLIICSMIFCLFFINSNIAASVPTITGFDITPENPTPLSTINLIIGIEDNETINDVRLIVEECSDKLNHIDSLNRSMKYSYSCCKDFYQLEFNLTHEDTTYLKCYVMIKSNNTWYTSKSWITNLSIDKIDYCLCFRDEYKIPGFEFVSLLTVIIIITGCLSKKYYKKL